MRDKAAKSLLEGKVVTQDPRFKPFVERVVNDLNNQLVRVRSQWLKGKISHEMVVQRSTVLRGRAQDKIARRIPQRRGAPMAEL